MRQIRNEATVQVRNFALESGYVPRDLFAPANDVAKVFAKLIGQPHFDAGHIDCIRLLGYTVELADDSPSPYVIPPRPQNPLSRL